MYYCVVIRIVQHAVGAPTRLLGRPIWVPHQEGPKLHQRSDGEEEAAGIYLLATSFLSHPDTYFS